MSRLLGKRIAEPHANEMKLIAIREALRMRLREMISDELTSGSTIAKGTGVAQAHISNFLNGTRGISFELAESLLDFAGLEVEDLIAEKARSERMPFVGSSQAHFFSVPIVSREDAESPHIQNRHARGTLLIGDHLLPKSVAANGRGHWHRFVAVEICPGETLVIDRHVYEGNGQIAFKVGKKICTGRLFLIDGHNYLRPDNMDDPVIPARHVVGTVVQAQQTMTE